MTPAEHYAEAERLLAEAARPDLIKAGHRGIVHGYFLAAAQVHATLALAEYMTPLKPAPTYTEWLEREK